MGLVGEFSCHVIAYGLGQLDGKRFSGFLGLVKDFLRRRFFRRLRPRRLLGWLFAVFFCLAFVAGRWVRWHHLAI